MHNAIQWNHLKEHNELVINRDFLKVNVTKIILHISEQITHQFGIHNFHAGEDRSNWESLLYSLLHIDLLFMLARWLLLVIDHGCQLFNQWIKILAELFSKS